MYHDDVIGMSFMRKRYEKEARAQEDFKQKHPRKETPRYPNRTRLKPPYFVMGLDDEPATTRQPIVSARQQAVNSARQAVIEPQQDSARPEPPLSARSEAPRIWSSRTDDILETIRSDWDTPRVERKLQRLMDEKANILQRIAEVDEALRQQEQATTTVVTRRRRS